MQKCKVDNCSGTNKRFIKGMCANHYEKSAITKEYRAWLNMKKRCYYKNSSRYKDYGGRGITVYEGWLHDSAAFISYVGLKPSANHSLDRIDNDGNYEPGNVRWATVKEQSTNKRESIGKRAYVRVKPLKKRSKRKEIKFNPKDFIFNST